MTDCLDAFLSEYGKYGEKYAGDEWLTKLDSFFYSWFWAKSQAVKREALEALIEDVEIDEKGRV